MKSLKSKPLSTLFKRFHLLAAMTGIFLFVVIMTSTACAPKPILGDIDEQAKIAVIRYESIDKETSGIVYRKVLDVERLIAEPKVPLLFAFYTRNDPVNSGVIPLLEQLADDYQDRAVIVFIDAAANPSLATMFSVQKTPQFTVVESGAIRRSLVGFDESTRTALEQLLQPWLK